MTMTRIAAAAALALGAGAADAMTVTAGFQLTLSGSTNVPEMTLANTSDAAFRIIDFRLTAGPATLGWDYVQDLTAPAGGTATLVAPDAVNNGLRSFAIEIDFTGFDPAESVGWRADLDGVATNVTRNFTTDLFNNGAADNAVVTVGFESLVPGLAQGPFAISFALPDGGSPYVFGGTRSFTVDGAPVVPVPAALPLLATGLAGLALAARRRRGGLRGA